VKSAKGDKVEVKGVRSPLTDESVVLAAEVKKGDVGVIGELAVGALVMIFLLSFLYLIFAGRCVGATK